MGQNVKNTYIGAFIGLKNSDKELCKKFDEIVKSDHFYERFCENFIYPYEGLEDKGILLASGDYSIDIDNDEEHVFDREFIESINFKEFEDRISVDYKEAIDELNDQFDGNIIVKSGIVIYWDEIA